MATKTINANLNMLDSNGEVFKGRRYLGYACEYDVQRRYDFCCRSDECGG